MGNFIDNFNKKIYTNKIGGRIMIKFIKSLFIKSEIEDIVKKMKDFF